MATPSVLVAKLSWLHTCHATFLGSSTEKEEKKPVNFLLFFLSSKSLRKTMNAGLTSGRGLIGLGCFSMHQNKKLSLASLSIKKK